MDIGQVGAAVGILGGIVVIGGGLIGLVAYAFLRRFDEERDEKQSEVFALTKEELELYRSRAARVPDLEEKLEVLREEVGAAKAIASLDGKLSNELARINERIAASDERTSRADAWQAASNKAIVEGINTLLAAEHRPPVQVTPPPETRRHGRGTS